MFAFIGGIVTGLVIAVVTGIIMYMKVCYDFWDNY